MARIPGRSAIAALVALGALAGSAPSALGDQALTLRQADPVKKPAIVNGTPTNITDVPWQVFLQSDPDGIPGGSVYNCGGSIIDADTIVTAGHCVYDSRTATPIPAAGIDVFAGLTNFNAPDASVQPRRVRLVRIHPNYVYTLENGGVAPDDVAVLELDTPLDLSTPTARAIPLVGANAYPAQGAAAQISGFGLQAPGGRADGQLYRLDTTVGDPLACGGEANAVLICVTSQVGSACQGDSGGPLVIGGVLVGVTSFVTVNGPTGECGTGSINGYTNLAAPEILDFVNGSATPPAAPRGGRDISARGVFQAGRSMTCSAGTWTGAPTFGYSFVDTRNGQVLQSGASDTYAFTSGDVGRRVACHVSATNAGGTGISRTEASPAIAADPTPPAPRPEPRPEPRPQPRPQPRRPQARRPAARPSLRLSVQASRTRVTAGSKVTYTIRVANRGRGAARRVVVCDAPGRGLVFAGLPRGTRKVRGAACWTLGTVRGNSTRTVRLTLRVAAATKPGLVVNGVALSSANGGRRSVAVRVRVSPAQSRGDTTPPGVTG